MTIISDHMKVGDVITLNHEPFKGVFYKVKAMTEDRVLIEAYWERECLTRRPLADGALIRERNEPS